LYTNAKTGLYKVINKNKVKKPIDNHMKSFIIENNNVFLEYKSSLELKAIRYCDFNKYITSFALEPFAIKYIKPTDGKQHRYYIDLFIEFKTGDKFLVEIKSKGETVPPKKPKKKTEKSIMNYQKALQTFAVNRAKWDAAKKFAESNQMKFIILTEDELR
jgi:hypothetical protein